MKWIKTIIIIVIMLVIAGFAYSVLSKMNPKEERPPAKIEKKVVSVTPVVLADQPVTIQGTGRLSSAHPIELVARVQGEMFRGGVQLEKGQAFRKGQLLFRIDDSQFIYGLHGQRSTFLNALSLILADLKFDFPDKYEKWYSYFQSIDVEKKLPKLPAIMEEREKIFLASRNILSQYYNIKSQEENLKYYYEYAPYSGAIAELYTEAGSVVNPGTRIARIIRTNDLEMTMPVSREEVALISQGQKAEVWVEGSDKRMPAIVIRIGDVIDQNTQSVNLYLKVKSRAKDALYEGMYLQAELNGRDLSQVMTFPRNAMINDDQVYVVEQDSILTLKDVNILHKSRESILFNGLEPGTLVVDKPLVNVYDKMIVQISSNENGNK